LKPQANPPCPPVPKRAGLSGPHRRRPCYSPRRPRGSRAWRTTTHSTVS
jgi:hypothetical protein